MNKILAALFKLFHIKRGVADISMAQLELVAFLLLSKLLWSHTALGQVTCTAPGEATCVCDLPNDGGRIDLTSIANRDGTPRFTNVPGETFQRYTYSYNPCYGFSISASGCNGNANAACQSETDGSNLAYSCGLISTESFVYNSAGNNELHYEGGDVGRYTTVELECDPDATEPVLRSFDDENYYYKFKLTTACACPNACSSGSGGSGGGGKEGPIGITLIFLALFGFVAYFIVGAVVMKFHFNKTGVEIIPNHKFWLALPYMIKDGFLFVYHSIAGLFRKKDSEYDKL